MQQGPITKYQPFPAIPLPDRQWPARVLTTAPTWCSVDLRDGNQALPIPMSVAEKLELFQLLVRIGFKEIEVGFPSASQIEFDFVRRLIEHDLVPPDVTMQVLVPARPELITRTFESVRGAAKVIVHLYNSTSPLQRQVVFGLERPAIVDIAVRGTHLIRELAPSLPGTQVTLQYSPESFSATELPFALEICEAVMEVWQPTETDKLILNLPATVELATPNVHADQIEWFCRQLSAHESAIVSLHTHNDRGSAVAATELGLLAGAERVEGTLFGNGERTGNVDIVTLALNLYTQGIAPGLDFSDLPTIREVYRRCTRLDVPLRQPYAGDLVFTAFSGTHQDAINKGLAAQDPTPGALWQVPYLPIDPQDIGRSYEAIIRINAQSGKGGVAYILESEFGYQLPKDMRIEFGRIINALADARGDEISNAEIGHAFDHEYLQRTTPYRLEAFEARTVRDATGERVACRARVWIDEAPVDLEGHGNGPIDAFVNAVHGGGGPRFDVRSYAEHSLGAGAEARAVAYIQIATDSGAVCFDAGIDTNIEVASIKAIVSALNRAVPTPR